MNIMYKCYICGGLYDWYETVYDNPNYNSSEHIKSRSNGKEYKEKSYGNFATNSIMFKFFDPLPERNGEAFEMGDTDEELEDKVINLCPDCMRELLVKCNFLKDFKKGSADSENEGNH